jgi:4-carboxymuconolactone decarboxylase
MSIFQHIPAIAQAQIVEERAHDRRMARIANRAVIESADLPFEGVAKGPDAARSVERLVGNAIERKFLPLLQRRHLAAHAYHFNLALDNGVKSREISEIITHLAFYAGWANAMSAVAIAKDVFAARHIGVDQLPAASVALLPLNEAAEAQRAKSVSAQFGADFPGVLQYTTDVLFRDLWLRPDLAPRDRSLVTISALIANGQTAQLAPHLNRAMDNGLTQIQAAEVITHLAFYVGWPNVFSAMPVAKDVFEKRSR